MKKIIFSLTAVVVIGVLVAAYVFLNPLMPILTGHAAKNLCSAVFASGRDADSVRSLDISFFPVNYSKQKVNYEDSTVVASFLWAESKAVYRKGNGAVILRGDVDPDQVRLDRRSIELVEYYDASEPWPMGETMPQVPTNPELEKVADSLIGSAYGGNPFTFMVLHKGVPVVESYREGFDKNTRVLSWSMFKSVISAMTGILVGDGLVDINAPVGLEQWASDERSKITLNNLLHMQSGLEWNENYGNESDVNLMLHVASDMAEYAINKPQVAPVDSEWVYSSGTTNIVSKVLRNKIACDSTYYDLAYNRLLAKIGVRNPVIETDLTGTIIGSSYLYMTTRDFARFGLLYSQDGVFNGERILPEGWVDYTRTPACASKGKYGASFWLNADGAMKDVPTDTYSCNGFNGQRIVIIPSEELVIVMTGYSPKKNAVDYNAMIRDVIKAVK